MSLRYHLFGIFFLIFVNKINNDHQQRHQGKETNNLVNSIKLKSSEDCSLAINFHKKGS
jgi:hypothetical protein